VPQIHRLKKYMDILAVGIGIFWFFRFLRIQGLKKVDKKDFLFGEQPIRQKGGKPSCPQACFITLSVFGDTNMLTPVT